MAFVLTPVPPIAEWLAEFDSFARRSPGFFAGRPVVVDISLMPPTRPDLVHMITELKRRHITIMGLDGRTPGELGADARGLPPILSGGKEIAALLVPPAEPADPQVTEAALAAVEAAFAGVPAAEPAQDAAAPADPAPGAASGPPEPAATEAATEAAPVATAPEPGEADRAPEAETLIIDEPVRSGQSIVHLKGDVIVVGPVASGSEIVASGSIHVYGALRGRAMAGTTGNRDARIFASQLFAELVAINGLYKTSDDLDRGCVGRAVQAWLDGDTLKMSAFSGNGKG